MYEPSYYLLQLSKTKYDGKHTSKQSYYQLKILLLFVANKSALFCCIRQLMYSMERQVYQVFLYSIVNLFATIFFMENITYHANDLNSKKWQCTKPKGVLVLKKFQILCQKSPGKLGTLNWNVKYTAYIHKGTQFSAIYVL